MMDGGKGEMVRGGIVEVSRWAGGIKGSKRKEYVFFFVEDCESVLELWLLNAEILHLIVIVGL